MVNKYDPDYQKLIDDAVAKGDFKTAAWNEKQQNKKIDDLGLDYEKTYKYVQYDDSDANSATDDTFDSYSYSGKKPTRNTQYADQQNKYLNNYLNQEAFSYDPKDDPLYQSYQEQYTRNGQLAMQDTLGQIAARTGGMASSYAGTAAQQTYDGYMRELADIIPQLRQAAYEMYQDKGQRYMNAFSMLGTQQDRSDGWYQDSLSQYNNDKAFDYNARNNDRMFDYQAGQDAIAQEQWQKGFDFDQEQARIGNAYKDKYFNFEQEQARIGNAYKDKYFNFEQEQARIGNRQWQQEHDLKLRALDDEPTPKEQFYMVEGIGELPESDIYRMLKNEDLIITDRDEYGNPTGFAESAKHRKALGKPIGLTR